MELDIQGNILVPSFSLFFFFSLLQCIHFLCFPTDAFIDYLTVQLLFTLTCRPPSSSKDRLFSFDQALTGSPQTIDSLHLNTFLNLENWWLWAQQFDGMCLCVWVMGQGTAGVQLMTTVSIYLLLNISRICRDGCFSLFTFICWGKQYFCLLYR